MKDHKDLTDVLVLSEGLKLNQIFWMVFATTDFHRIEFFFRPTPLLSSTSLVGLTVSCKLGRSHFLPGWAEGPGSNYYPSGYTAYPGSSLHIPSWTTTTFYQTKQQAQAVASYHRAQAPTTARYQQAQAAQA